MIYANKTIKGRRAKNEDSCYIPKSDNSAQIVIVADGMGGHNAGDVASSIAVKEIVAYFDEIIKKHSVEIDIINAIGIANDKIYSLSKSIDSYRGMGTTVTMAVLNVNEAYIANVGDSRTYFFNGKYIKQVTKDHSFVQMLIDSGEITKDMAKNHPRRNIITRAIGTSSNEETDIFLCRWQKGDKLLLCSDGLSGAISESDMESILSKSISLKEMCDELVDVAYNNGSTDNITVVIVENSKKSIS